MKPINFDFQLDIAKIKNPINTWRIQGMGLLGLVATTKRFFERWFKKWQCKKNKEKEKREKRKRERELFIDAQWLVSVL